MLIKDSIPGGNLHKSKVNFKLTLEFLTLPIVYFNLLQLHEHWLPKFKDYCPLKIPLITLQIGHDIYH